MFVVVIYRVVMGVFYIHTHPPDTLILTPDFYFGIKTSASSSGLQGTLAA